MKMKLFGTGRHSKVVEPGVAITLNGRSSKRVPEPFNGTKLAMKAEIRSVLIVPGPVLRTLAETFQFGSLVSAALCTGGELLPLVAKLITAESKVKSPWNPT